MDSQLASQVIINDLCIQVAKKLMLESDARRTMKGALILAKLMLREIKIY